MEYFSLDVDFFQDEKIQFISARFGMKGEAITVRLLCKIYRNGYYVDWGEDAALLFAKGVGDNCQHSCVNDVVYELLKRGFFNKSIFERFSVLTSRGIQKRYFKAAERRKQVSAISEYLLVDPSDYPNLMPKTQNVSISGQNVYIFDENADILKQSKVKESKVYSLLSEPVCDEPDEQSGSDEKTRFAPDSDPYLAAEYMAKKILKRDSGYRYLQPAKREKTLQQWARDIDLLIRVDKVDMDEFRKVLQFSQTDSFWSTNILSGAKLRKQYDQLKIKMEAKSDGIR